MWDARTKQDLIIEVWEKLDCETVGASEIEAIETAVESVFGKQAVDSPMRIARMLADEGAELRHSEIMSLYLDRLPDHSLEAALRNILDTTDFRRTLRSLREMGYLRTRLESGGDKKSLKELREMASAERDRLQALARRNVEGRELMIEIAEWLRLWIHSPAIYESWVALRMKSDDFKSKFGAVE